MFSEQGLICFSSLLLVKDHDSDKVSFVALCGICVSREVPESCDKYNI